MNLQEHLKTFFKMQKIDDMEITLVREDGILLFSNAQSKNDVQNNGALVAGLWQAAENINDITGNDLRLGFDSSDSGFYIVKVSAVDNSLLLCSKYKKLSNPGKHKLNVRKLKQSIEQYLNINLKEQENRDTYLFSNITDDEMDKLFAYTGI